MFTPLNYPPTKLNLEKRGEHIFVQCLVRKKWYILTPEEWVRQHVIAYLHEKLSHPLSLFSVEKSMEYNGLSKRWDVVCFDRQGQAQILIECKRPEVPLSRETILQISAYQAYLQSTKIAVTNGLDTWVYHENKWESGMENF